MVEYEKTTRPYVLRLQIGTVIHVDFLIHGCIMRIVSFCKYIYNGFIEGVRFRYVTIWRLFINLLNFS